MLLTPRLLFFLSTMSCSISFSSYYKPIYITKGKCVRARCWRHFDAGSNCNSILLLLHFLYFKVSHIFNFCTIEWGKSFDYRRLFYILYAHNYFLKLHFISISLANIIKAYLKYFGLKKMCEIPLKNHLPVTETLHYLHVCTFKYNLFENNILICYKTAS